MLQQSIQFSSHAIHFRQWLTRKQDSNILSMEDTDAYGWLTLWLLVCKSQSQEVVKFLHTNAERYGIDLQFQATNPTTMENVLHVTCRAQRIDNLSYLLSVSKSIGIDVNAPCTYKGTMLHIACGHKNTEMVKLILEKSEEEYKLDFRKSFSTYNHTRSSVFEEIWSFQPGNNSVDVELLQCVLKYAKEKNIELNETERAISVAPPTGSPMSWKWRSLLDIVSSEGDLKHVLLVLEYMDDCGVHYDVYAEDNDGMTPIDLVENSRRLKFLQDFHSHQLVNCADCASIEAEKIDDELTELLLIILPNEKGKQTIASRGDTLLRYARRYGTPKHVRYLLQSLEECGINIRNTVASSAPPLL